MNKFLQQWGLHPVLVDVGASYAPPPIWRDIAEQSIYMGFDPDLRETQQLHHEGYHQATFINRAVTATPQEEVHFFLTQYPACSSTLAPNVDELAHYVYADLFNVTGEAQAAAITLAQALTQTGLDRLDWFKTDSQGTDLRLFQSIPDSIRQGILAVDLEPGLINAYQGEDLWVDAHPHMLKNGFWLSNLAVKGALRGTQATLQAELGYTPSDYNTYNRALPAAPAWCEARYLRRLDHLQDAPLTSYQLLWVFAGIDGQWTFALELIRQAKQLFGESPTLQTMQHHTHQQIHAAIAAHRRPQGLPRRLLRRLKRLIT